MVKIKQKDISVLYLCLHKKISDKCGLSSCIKKEELFSMLASEFHIPKKLRVIIMKEMESLGMIEELNSRARVPSNQLIKVNHSFMDPLENANQLYVKFKIFGLL